MRFCAGFLFLVLTGWAAPPNTLGWSFQPPRVPERPPNLTPDPGRVLAKALAGVPKVPVLAVPAEVRSLSRTLGLSVRRIVVDAGHGGHDEGAVGPSGLAEKDVVLDVALRFGRVARARTAVEVVLTRSDDTFVDLRRRTAIANDGEADIFLSIHANASPNPGPRGVETYYLNFSASNVATDLAARENAGNGMSIRQLKGILQAIAANEKRTESKFLAGTIQSTVTGSRWADRGVKHAPFLVLTGAAMPSVLVEIGFLSNPSDAARLATPTGRQQMAESICAGVESYISSLR